MPHPALLVLALLLASPLGAQSIDLPAPQKTGGLPLMDALAKRATARAFDPRELPAQELSNLLWAAFGINRPDGKRTAPSARNFREVDLYVLLPTGAYLYNPAQHRLDLVAAGDQRAHGARQAFAQTAPLTLVYIADTTRMGDSKPAQQRDWAHIDTGYISQNVYLYCASAGLATGARASFDEAGLTAKLHLRPTQIIVLAQSVGYPKP